MAPFQKIDLSHGKLILVRVGAGKIDHGWIFLFLYAHSCAGD
jgi:hypothetical protein